MSWRDWRLTLWATHRAYALGVISGSAQTGNGRGGWRLLYVTFRGARPYVLGLKREAWGYPWHLIRHRHWPSPIQLGMCGKCCPMPCCGSTGWDCLDGCDGEIGDRA